MCVIGKNAEKAVVANGSDSAELDKFHGCLFMLARAFVHELGHVFVTMLGNGQADTPPISFADKTGTIQKLDGEAGSLVENWIYSGTSSVCHDPTKGNDQVCSVDIKFQ